MVTTPRPKKLITPVFMTAITICTKYIY